MITEKQQSLQYAGSWVPSQVGLGFADLGQA